MRRWLAGAGILSILFCLPADAAEAHANPQASTPSASQAQADLPAAGVASLKSYIHNAWQTLTRSMEDCKSIADPKLKEQPVLYVPHDFQLPAKVHALESACGVRVQQLPKSIDHIDALTPQEVGQQGLLYLPNPYIVPGGRFNEMYGWDSYFIIRGLLDDNQLNTARGMIENFFFEIDHYGAVLNANRTYYFTRSQPPFLTSMISAYLTAEKAQGHDDRQWLEKAYGYAQRDYDLWTHDPHLAGDTGLARYFDFGEGPVPEMGDDPHYYAQVTSYVATHPTQSDSYLAGSANTTMAPAASIGPVFTVQVCGGGQPSASASASSSTAASQFCAAQEKVSLSEDYYKGDRSMRESGFDISFRFGPFSGSTHHFAPVCLNSLLYRAETDMEQMATTLGKPEQARRWHERAELRKSAINKYLWKQDSGMFFDYDFLTKQQSSYDYVTTFYPLWAGLATPEQAHAVAQNLGTFERAGGVAMSDRITGVQWDLPYGWAPIQLLAVEGLRRYGFHDAADRISREFVSTVLQNFQREGTIREKYNVVTRTTDANVTVGYKSNVVGFGWTNGVTLELLRGLAGH